MEVDHLRFAFDMALVQRRPARLSVHALCIMIGCKKLREENTEFWALKSNDLV